MRVSLIIYKYLTGLIGILIARLSLQLIGIMVKNLLFIFNFV